MEDFNSELMPKIGMKQYIGTMYRIPGTGWRIYDASSFSSPWGWDHDDDGKEYGTAETLASALHAILSAEHSGMGDNPGYRDISIPAILRIIENLEAL